MKCSGCSAQNPDGQKFCGECGAALIDAPASGPPVADRRPVTVLFADISGFTSLSEKLDPGAVRDLTSACFERVVPCIERYGGTVDKFMGDEVMALFGAPQAHENDAERALRAALEMREALVGFNRQRGTSLGLHFGINSGFVYAGAVGTGAHQDYSVMGDAVNVSARLKEAAKSGEILVGPDTYHQTEHLFDFEKAESLRLKGKAQPVSVCRLICARAAPSAGERLSRGLSSPLVDRASEVASFKKCLAGLDSGQGGIIILTGEAGMGKSRLVAEVRREAKKTGTLWLEGHALSFGRTISYWPLLEIIQQDAGIETDDPEAERWAKLAARVGSLFAQERDEILPYLATLLSLSLPEELARKARLLDGEAMGRQIYRSTRLHFARLAKERPTVIVFEDLHWLDGSSAALLEHLLPLTKESPILFCLVSRPEAESALPRLQELTRSEHAERLTEMGLEPLSAQDTATLACNLIRLDDLPPQLQDGITAKAEGNPFYVEEVVRSLIDEGGLVKDERSGRYRVTEEAARIAIPDTLLGVITARIDRLDEDLRQVLRLASVVGRSFFYRVLAAITEAEEELDKDLADLEERELIREKARIPELEYVFKHALVQEATYESILIQRRKELHRRVAQVLETLFGERLEEFYSFLAYHYSKAEDWENAQGYLFKAGDQAGSIAADAEALSHYEEALEAYTRVFGDKWDPVERAILERKMGEALYRRGEHDRAREYLYRTLTLLGRPVPASPGALGRAIVAQLLIQLGHRLFWWLPRRSLSPAGRRAAEEREPTYICLTWIDHNTPPMFYYLLAGLNESEAAGGLRLGNWGTAAGFACSLVPLRRTARYYFHIGERVLERVRESDSREDIETKALSYMMLGMYEHVTTGEWTKAVQHLHLARQDSRTVGDTRSWGAATDQLLHLFIDRGELDETLRLSEEAITFGQETGDRVAEAWGHMDVGEVLFAQGAFEDAEAHLHLAAQLLLVSLQPVEVARTNARIAHCYLKRGRLAEARAILKEETARARDTNARGYFIRNVRIGNATVSLLALERATRADRKRALKEAKTACRALLKSTRADVPALVPAYRMQGTYEYLRGHPSKAEKWWRKSLAHAHKLGARYEEALTQLEIGKRTGDRTALETAEAAFAQMGAAWDLAEARRLLERPEPARLETVAS